MECESSVCIASGYGLEVRGSVHDMSILLFSTESRPTVRLIKSPINSVPGRGTDHPSSPSAQLEKAAYSVYSVTNNITNK
jgi:hypothetical protein